jgi:hypothetical protein
MRIVDRFLGVTEEIVLQELFAIVADNGLRVFPKPRMADVIEKDEFLESRIFSYYTHSHFDFLVASHDLKPVMTIEYDGPYHSRAEQVDRDKIKNLLCRKAGLPIIRINANHVKRTSLC